MGGKKKGGKKKDAGHDLPVHKFEPMPTTWPGKISSEDLFAAFAAEVRTSIQSSQQDQLVTIRVRQVDWEFHDFFITLPKRATVYRLQCEIAKVQHLSSVLPQDIIIYTEPPPDPLVSTENDGYGAEEPAVARKHPGSNHDLSTNMDAVTTTTTAKEKTNNSAQETEPKSPKTVTICQDPTEMLCTCFPEIAAFREKVRPSIFPYHDDDTVSDALQRHSVAPGSVGIPRSIVSTQQYTSALHGMVSANPTHMNDENAQDHAKHPEDGGHDTDTDQQHHDGAQAATDAHNTTSKHGRPKSAHSRGSKRGKRTGSRPTSARSITSSTASQIHVPVTGEQSVQFYHNLKPKTARGLGGSVGGNHGLYSAGIVAPLPNGSQMGPKKSIAGILLPPLRPMSAQSTSSGSSHQRMTKHEPSKQQERSQMMDLIHGTLERARSLRSSPLHTEITEPQELPQAITIYYDVAPYISKKLAQTSMSRPSTAPVTKTDMNLSTHAKSDQPNNPRLAIGDALSLSVNASRSRRPSSVHPLQPASPPQPDAVSPPSSITPHITPASTFDIDSSILMRDTREWRPRQVFTAFENIDMSTHVVGDQVELGFHRTVRTVLLVKSLVARRRKKKVRKSSLRRDGEANQNMDEYDRMADQSSESASRIDRRRRASISQGLNAVMDQIAISLRNV